MRFQFLSSLLKREGIQAVFLGFQRQRLLQDNRHLAGKVQSPPTLACFHLLEVFQQMPDTFLFEPRLQFPIIVSHIAIRSQDALELLTQNIDHGITAAIIADGIHGHFSMREDPQPGCQRADPPTGLVRIDDTALADHFNQFFIDRLSCAGQLFDRLDTIHFYSLAVQRYR